MQNEQIKNKSFDTHFQNHGVRNVWQHRKGRKKYEETMLERHGVLNPKQNEAIKEKIRVTNIERYGAENVGGLPEFQEKARQTSIERYGNNMPNVSRGQQEWLDSLRVKTENREVLIEGYRVDGFDPETGTIYEFNGDFWHGNPEIFNPHEINPKNGKTYGDLYQATKEKEQMLLDAGFVVISIWESEWKKTK